MKNLIALLLVLFALVSSGLFAASGGETPGDVTTQGRYEEWVEIIEQ